MKIRYFQFSSVVLPSLALLAVGFFGACRSSGTLTQLSEADSNALHQRALTIASRKNVVFDADGLQLNKVEMPFVVEIPSKSTYKYELRTATGQVILDRALCPRRINEKLTIGGYPVNYGVAAGRFNVDGDPLDLLVLGSEADYKNQVKTNTVAPKRVRIVGTVKMEECDAVPCQEKDWVQDWKVLAVDSRDKRYSKVSDLSQVSKTKLAELDIFFSNYKGLKDGHPQTRVAGFLDKTDTMAFITQFKPLSRESRQVEIAQCKEVYSKTLLAQDKLLANPQLNPKFSKCIARVFDARFFTNQKNLSFYLSYAAYNLINIDLKKQTPLADAVNALQLLRLNKEKSFRFVGTDRPLKPGTYASNGSGNDILEWVKTKDRNKGCSPDFPKQHYEVNPIVDL